MCVLFYLKYGIQAFQIQIRFVMVIKSTGCMQEMLITCISLVFDNGHGLSGQLQRLSNTLGQYQKIV